MPGSEQWVDVPLRDPRFKKRPDGKYYIELPAGHNIFTIRWRFKEPDPWENPDFHVDRSETPATGAVLKVLRKHVRAPGAAGLWYWLSFGRLRDARLIALLEGASVLAAAARWVTASWLAQGAADPLAAVSSSGVGIFILAALAVIFLAHLITGVVQPTGPPSYNLRAIILATFKASTSLLGVPVFLGGILLGNTLLGVALQVAGAALATVPHVYANARDAARQRLHAEDMGSSEEAAARRARRTDLVTPARAASRGAALTRREDDPYTTASACWMSASRSRQYSTPVE
jgi:hypothetical protein